MCESCTVYLKLTLADGKIVGAERVEPEKKVWVPAKPVEDLRGKRIRGFHGLAVSQNSPECIILPVWTDGGIVYVEICPPTVEVGWTFP